jgi:hypothetical protein
MTWKISHERIQEIMDESLYEVWEPFPGITIVAMNLPNGYTLVESSGCVDPAEYDRKLGIQLCKNALERKVWQLYGFMRKQEFSDAKGGEADDQDTKAD